MSKGVDYLSTVLLDTSSLLVSLSPSLARAKAKKDNGGTWQRRVNILNPGGRIVSQNE